MSSKTNNLEHKCASMSTVNRDTKNGMMHKCRIEMLQDFSMLHSHFDMLDHTCTQTDHTYKQ